MDKCRTCGRALDEQSNYCGSCGGQNGQVPDGYDQASSIKLYAEQVNSLLTAYPEHDHSLMMGRLRDKLRISDTTHQVIWKKLSDALFALGPLTTFRLEFNERVPDAFAGHDTYLEFRVHNDATNEFLHFQLYWDDPESPDEDKFVVLTSRHLQCGISAIVGGSHVFHRPGVKSVEALELTVTNVLNDSAKFRVAPFKVKIGSASQIISNSVTNHTQISIEGRGVIDASGLVNEAIKPNAIEPHWLALQCSPVLEVVEHAWREAVDLAKHLDDLFAQKILAENRKLEAEEVTRRDIEEKACQEAQAIARREAEEVARRDTEAKVRLEAEEKARRDIAEKARQEVEAIARRETEEAVRREAEARASLEAEEKARRDIAEKARQEAEAIARRETEEAARREAEARASLEAEEKARRQAEEVACFEAVEKVLWEAKEKIRLDVEDKIRHQSEEKARRDITEKARLEAQAIARREAEEVARRDIEAKARLAAEEKARRDIEAKARLAAEEKARREALELLRLGERHFDDVNFREAVGYFRKSANAGNITAQYYLGMCYQYGFGVEISISESANWLELARSQSGVTGQPIKDFEAHISRLDDVSYLRLAFNDTFSPFATGFPNDTYPSVFDLIRPGERLWPKLWIHDNQEYLNLLSPSAHDQNHVERERPICQINQRKVADGFYPSIVFTTRYVYLLRNGFRENVIRIPYSDFLSASYSEHAVSFMYSTFADLRSYNFNIKIFHYLVGKFTPDAFQKDEEKEFVNFGKWQKFLLIAGMSGHLNSIANHSVSYINKQVNTRLLNASRENNDIVVLFNDKYALGVRGIYYLEGKKKFLQKQNNLFVPYSDIDIVSMNGTNVAIQRSTGKPIEYSELFGDVRNVFSFALKALLAN
jgi:TPR repeat protein